MRSVRVTILGTAQDGGVPQPGCERECCTRIRSNEGLRRYPVSLGIVGSDGSKHLIEASRHMGEQFEIWNSVDPCDGPLATLSITHAHLGHIDGLGLFGTEVMGVENLKIHCSHSVSEFIEMNPMWKGLREQGVLCTETWTPNQSFEPSIGCGFSITPIPVPHRDELSDMHALLIATNQRKLLFLPDHDSWEDTLAGVSIREWLAELSVDVALLDGTFWDLDELPHRDMSQVPHPPVSQSLNLLGSRKSEDPHIHFIHLNHTNPLCNPDSTELEELMSMGWNLSKEGDSFTLERL